MLIATAIYRRPLVILALAKPLANPLQIAMILMLMCIQGKPPILPPREGMGALIMIVAVPQKSKIFIVLNAAFVILEEVVINVPLMALIMGL